MTRLVIYLVISLVLALGATWLISLPGTVSIDIGTHRMQPGLGTAIFAVVVLVVVSILAWAIIRRIVEAPRRLQRRTERKRQEAGLAALSDSVLALQAGDAARAKTLAREARAKLPDNAAASILEARAELSLGDYDAAREHYRALISNDNTALAALAGLYAQAEAQGKPRAALTFARKASAIAPNLPWASEAVFADVAARRAWDEALAMVAERPAQTKEARAEKRRRQAVLETALAQDKEMTEPDAALVHAQTALKLIPEFVPAALIAGRILIDRGDTRRASSLLRRVWKLTGHPHVAMLYAHVHSGASALERLKRVRALIEAPGDDRQAAIVLARAAVEAYEWPTARNALAAFAASQPTQAICLLMAEIEEGEHGDQGKAREWLARAVRAPRDPVWTADGITSEDWAPVGPVSGRLDAYEWKVPVEARQPATIDAERRAALTAPETATVEAAAIAEPPAEDLTPPAPEREA